MHEYSQRQHVPFLLFQVSMYANEFFLKENTLVERMVNHRNA